MDRASQQPALQSLSFLCGGKKEGGEKQGGGREGGREGGKRKGGKRKGGRREEGERRGGREEGERKGRREEGRKEGRGRVREEKEGFILSSSSPISTILVPTNKATYLCQLLELILLNMHVFDRIQKWKAMGKPFLNFRN